MYGHQVPPGVAILLGRTTQAAGDLINPVPVAFFHVPAMTFRRIGNSAILLAVSHILRILLAVILRASTVIASHCYSPVLTVQASSSSGYFGPVLARA